MIKRFMVILVALCLFTITAFAIQYFDEEIVEPEVESAEKILSLYHEENPVLPECCEQLKALSRQSGSGSSDYHVLDLNGNHIALVTEQGVCGVIFEENPPEEYQTEFYKDLAKDLIEMHAEMKKVGASSYKNSYFELK